MSTASSRGGPFRRTVVHVSLGGLIAFATGLLGVSPALAAGWATIASVNSGVGTNYLKAISSTSATDIWTVGSYQGATNLQTLAEHSTNGTSWALVTTQNNATTVDNLLRGVVAITPTNVWAVGSYNTSGFVSQPLIEHWTGGASFTTVATANLGVTVNQGFNAVYANSATDIWAVGNQTSGAYIQHWNGTTWTISTSAAADLLSGVDGTGPSDVWAVGYIGTAPFAEHWNGTAWSVPSAAPTPPSTNSSQLESITAITSTDVWAVGYGVLTSNGVSRTLTEHWNGTVWSIVASVNIGAITKNNDLHSVSASGSADVWAVGVSTGASPNDQSLAEHWDGTSWTLSSPTNPCTTNNVDMYGVKSITSANVWAAGNTTCPSGTNTVTLTFQYTSVVTCTGGSLTLTSPATAAFGTVTLNGSDQTTTGNLAFTASDMTGSGAGWAISGTSTQFASGGNTLPTTASAVTGSSAADPGGNCALPVNTIGTPANLPAGVGPPTAAKLYNSTATNGKGPTTVTLTFRLSIPASTHVGAYASTWTFTIASGP